MTLFFPGSVTSDGNENGSTTSYQIGPNFGRAHNLHWLRGPNSAQWPPLGLATFRILKTFSILANIVLLRNRSTRKNHLMPTVLTVTPEGQGWHSGDLLHEGSHPGSLHVPGESVEATPTQEHASRSEPAHVGLRLETEDTGKDNDFQKFDCCRLLNTNSGPKGQLSQISAIHICRRSQMGSSSSSSSFPTYPYMWGKCFLWDVSI